MRRPSLCFLLLPLVVLLAMAASVYADLDCDGVDDLLTTSLPLSTFIAGDAFTLMGWIKVQSTAPTATSCTSGAALTSDGASGYLSLGRSTNTTFCGYMFDTGEQVVSTASTPGWSHLALKLASGTLGLYLNGVLVATTGAVGAVGDLGGTVLLCAAYETIWLADRVADVRYYATAVPDAEVAHLGKSKLRLLSRTVPSAYWPLDTCPHGTSGQGVTFPDRSGNQRPLTGDDGDNNTGLTCQGTELLSKPWGVQ